MLRLPLPGGAALRLLEPRDADELQALIGANRGRLAPWMGWAAAADLEQTRRFIRLTRQQIADDDGLQTAIVRDGRIVGMAGFHGVDWVHRSTKRLGFAHEGTLRRAERVGDRFLDMDVFSLLASEWPRT